MAITKSASDISQKWANRLQGSANEIKAGVNAVTVNPMEKAVAAQAKMRANWLNAVDTGKWAENTSAVTLTDWKNRMNTVGVDRIIQGAVAGQSNMTAYMQKAIPVMNNLINQIDSMPSNNIQDSINRSAAWIMGMKAFGDTL